MEHDAEQVWLCGCVGGWEGVHVWVCTWVCVGVHLCTCGVVVNDPHTPTPLLHQQQVIAPAAAHGTRVG